MGLFGSEEQSLTVVLRLKNEFSKALDDVERQVTTMRPTFEKMAAAGSVAFGGIAFAAKKSLDAYQENEVAVSRLTHILKTSVDASDAQIQALLDQAEALERVGVVSADVIKTGQGTFATFDLQAESIQKLTPAFLDMVVAEKGVNATTEDMISFANGLGQALQGNFQSLTQRGFILDEATKKLVKEGTETERVAALVSVLNSTYEGMNETQRKTSAGMEKGLTLAFNRMQEALGEGLVPVLNSVMEKLLPVLNAIGDWIEKHPELTAKIVLSAAAVAGLVAVVGALGLALPVVAAGIAVLLGPVGLVAAAIAGLILVVRNLDQIFQILTTDLGSVWAGLKIMFKEGVNYLVGLAEGWANSWVQAANTIIGALNKIKFSIPSWVPGVGGKSFGINIPTVPEVKLPRFEHGGIVPGAPGRAVPIIAHSGERVIPASQADRSPSASITVNIYNPSVHSQRDVETLKGQIDKALRGLMRDHKLSVV